MVVRLYRDNPRALGSGLSTVQADKPCSTLLENIIHGVDLPGLRYLVLKFWVSGIVLQYILVRYRKLKHAVFRTETPTSMRVI